MPHPHRYNSPKVKESKGVQLLTSIWIVPFIAMLIALWLAYQYYAKIGPTILISFKSNAGLIANQSQLKLRDVTIGMVSNISLSDDGNGVQVTVKVNKDVSKYLNEKAKFWIVHPDVGSHGISGLDTLLSGSYIELNGEKEEETKYYFTGLEKPYIDKGAKGKYFILSAPYSNDITEGSNVYYRMIKVGRVERVAISPDGKKVNFTVFIKEQYTPFVNNQSQFYTNSNFSIDLSQGKLDINIASVSQLVHGGISVYTPLQSLAVDTNQSKEKQRLVYPLFKSLNEMKAKHLKMGTHDKIYAFKFLEERTKLEIGSPVEFNGFQVGYVTDIKNSFANNSHTIDSKVFAIIHVEAFTTEDTNRSGEEVITNLVNKGLKATLNNSLPVVGSDFIDLVFDNNKTASIIKTAHYELFPTIKKESKANLLDETQKFITKLEKLPLESLLEETKNVIKKVEKLPLESLLNSANKLVKESNAPVQNLLAELQETTQSINDTVQNFNISVSNINDLTAQESLQNLPVELSQTLAELNNTLLSFQALANDYGADSKFSSELSLTLHELSLTAESMGRISQKLEKKPNALILGDD